MLCPQQPPVLAVSLHQNFSVLSCIEHFDISMKCPIVGTPCAVTPHTLLYAQLLPKTNLRWRGKPLAS